MIVWLNGPFGIGKTSTAEALVRRLPNAHHFDPELLGPAARALVRGLASADDYQDLALWRALVPETARALRATYARTLVIPMTVWRHDYAAELSEGLRAADPDLQRFRLTAPESVLRARILARSDAEGSHGWCLSHLPTGLALMDDPAFGEAVSTDNVTPDQVAEAILGRLAIR